MELVYFGIGGLVVYLLTYQYVQRLEQQNKELMATLYQRIGVNPYQFLSPPSKNAPAAPNEPQRASEGMPDLLKLQSDARGD